jgi:hypothetical protein
VDHLEQTITDLAQLMRGTNEDHERRGMCLKTYFGEGQTLDLFLKAHIAIMFIWIMMFTTSEALEI